MNGDVITEMHAIESGERDPKGLRSRLRPYLHRRSNGDCVHFPNCSVASHNREGSRNEKSGRCIQDSSPIRAGARVFHILTFWALEACIRPKVSMGLIADGSKMNRLFQHPLPSVHRRAPAGGAKWVPEVPCNLRAATAAPPRAQLSAATSPSGRRPIKNVSAIWPHGHLLPNQSLIVHTMRPQHFHQKIVVTGARVRDICFEFGAITIQAQRRSKIP